jgi:hypothetical protein
MVGLVPLKSQLSPCVKKCAKEICAVSRSGYGGPK